MRRGGANETHVQPPLSLLPACLPGLRLLPAGSPPPSMVWFASALPSRRESGRT